MKLEEKLALSLIRIEKNKAFLEANKDDLDEQTIDTLQKVINDEITAYVTIIFNRYK